ncbi:hypothetical protein DN730_07930 [Marinomonas piezotolerans]|uniref:Morphogenetic protein n=1 Tax=Marinomonas piezotolerans TaxID=2213058 RepID=A0A370U981_9GAMM|nr:hypothetical protein [Marinomonas piezotolerans]RDL44325.1 hypothetical protein DN730_07930 [Marinomonas piezotolerans]
MKERPILLNTDMVKAVIDGRKTQTRRPVKKEHIEHIKYVAGSNDDDTEFDFLGLSYGKCQLDNGEAERPQWLLYCTEYPEEGVIPIGQGSGAVGDRLWVRETFAALDAGSYEQAKPTEGINQDIRYKASERLANQDADVRGYDWKPSIHMPRWACRLVLEITDVRIERVQEITEEDAKKEGMITEQMAADAGLSWRFGDRRQFQDLWRKLYPNSWENNDWVWVIDFKIVELNGKKMEQAA